MKLFISIIWGISVILLYTLFIFLFKNTNVYISFIFLSLSSFMITLIIEPFFPILSPLYYLISKFLLLFLHSYFAFLYNPWILIYFYNGKVFLYPKIIFNNHIFIEKSLDAFKVMFQFKTGLFEIIFVSIGVLISLVIKKLKFKKEEKEENVINKLNYLYLISFGFFTFLLFHLAINLSVLYNSYFKYMASLYLFISSIINSLIFLRPFYKSIRNEKKVILYFYPLIFYYLTLFILSPLDFVVNILNRIIVFPYEGIFFLLIGSYFYYSFIEKHKFK
ncbi:MAG: hypothetical protein H5U37_01380, partial [Caldisericia bacterium]|nr:hypothetical protein [Caldisericia bacterium]